LESDHSVYINAHAIIAVYMDDLLIFAQGAEVFHWLKNILCEKISMTDLGEVQFILGLQVTWDKSQRSITLGQSSYIAIPLTKFQMDAYNPVATPLEVGAKLSKKQSPSLEKEESEMADIPYRRAVGSLMYCGVGTRPDIAGAMGVVVQFLNNLDLHIGM
jgi:ATP-binding cassette subfamily B (MDR/TAP) protein 1